PLVDRELRATLPPGLLGATPSVVVVLTSMLARVERKYLERGFRFALLEAGHIGQNLGLVATALGLASTCVGGFCDDEMNRLLGLDRDDEVSTYLFLVGRSAANTQAASHLPLPNSHHTESNERTISAGRHQAR